MNAMIDFQAYAKFWGSVRRGSSHFLQTCQKVGPTGRQDPFVLRSGRSKLSGRQDGLVSIMVTMILMIVISLIVIGFAQVSRRNQREVLDRQLSTQAFYAAESGVNDVRNLMKTVGAPPAKTTCPNTGPYYSALNPVVDAKTSTSYSCVLVNPTPTQLDFSRIDSTASTIVKLRSSDPADAIASVTLTWEPDQSVAPSAVLTGCPASPTAAFSSTASWTCGYGILRLDLVPTDLSLTTDQLQQDAMTSFVVPQSGAPGTAISYPTAPTPANGANTLFGVGCDATHCTLKINNLAGAGHAEYYLRMLSWYRGVPLQINGTTAAGKQVKFTGAHIVIDSTGRAQDVLRRIQVQVSAGNGSEHNQDPDNALSAFGPICKRFSATGGFFQNDTSASGIPVAIQSDPQANRLCKP